MFDSNLLLCAFSIASINNLLNLSDLSGDGLDAGSISVRSSAGSSSRNSENRLSRDTESIGSNERYRHSLQVSIDFLLVSSCISVLYIDY